LNPKNSLFRLFKETVERIEKINKFDGESEVKFFFEEKFNLSISQIIINDSIDLSMEEISKEIEEYVKRRKKREPVQYIIGHTWFYGRRYYTDSHVLIPRNETELLVEEAIKIIGDKKFKILEIGVGSGCIGRTLLEELPSIKYVGTDINKYAIKLTQKNIGKNKRAKIIQQDIYKGEEIFDMIISNPPYIEEEEYSGLEPELKYEPKSALVSGENGLDVIESILKKCKHNLKKDGFLLLEIGHSQGKTIRAMVESTPMKLLKIVKDYSNFDRIVIMQKVG